MTPLLGVLVGAAATLLLIVLVVAIVVHQRQKKKRQRQLQSDSGTTVPPSVRPASPSHPAPNAPDGHSIVSTGTLRRADHHQRDTGPHSAVDGQSTLVREVKANGNGRLPAGSTPQHYSPQRSCSSSPTVYHKDPDIILRDMGKGSGAYCGPSRGSSIDSGTWIDRYRLRTLAPSSGKRFVGSDARGCVGDPPIHRARLGSSWKFPVGQLGNA
jgi:hypothetical protein